MMFLYFFPIVCDVIILNIYLQNYLCFISSVIFVIYWINVNVFPRNAILVAKSTFINNKIKLLYNLFLYERLSLESWWIIFVLQVEKMWLIEFHEIWVKENRIKIYINKKIITKQMFFGGFSIEIIRHL